MSGKFVNHFNRNFKAGHGSKCPCPKDRTGRTSSLDTVSCLQCDRPIKAGSREVTVRSTGDGTLRFVHLDCLNRWLRRGPCSLPYRHTDILLAK